MPARMPHRSLLWWLFVAFCIAVTASVAIRSMQQTSFRSSMKMVTDQPSTGTGQSELDYWTATMRTVVSSFHDGSRKTVAASQQNPSASPNSVSVSNGPAAVVFGAQKSTVASKHPDTRSKAAGVQLPRNASVNIMVPANVSQDAAAKGKRQPANGVNSESAAKARPRELPFAQFRLDIPSTEGSNSSQEDPMAAVCADTVCGEKYLLNFPQRSQQLPVPAIRHILWKSEKVSKYFLQQMHTWQRIHPNWTSVLWRDTDLEPFVRKYFLGKIYQKYKSLPTSGVHGIKRIDMFRYMLMYKFGGVYADLDYSLVSSLDPYRRYPAVVTREPEPHAVQFFGLFKWPLSILSNPAFFMSAPGHPFFLFALHQLVDKSTDSIKMFAGPMGLNSMLSAYYQLHMSICNPTEFVYIPPSYSFYPYDNNRMDTAGHLYLSYRLQLLKKACEEASDSTVPQVQQYCRNIIKLDPITNQNHTRVAIHDQQKKKSVHVDPQGKEFALDMQNATQHIKNLKLGRDWT